MSGQDSASLRYSRGAMWFHWVIAVLVVANLLLGLYHEDFGKAARAWLMFFHKANGITLLGLTIARLLWRLGHRPPPFDPVMLPWEKLLAGFVHRLFYLLLIVIPLTGWMLSSSSDRPVNFWGLFEIGTLPVPRSDEAHELLGKGMIGLIALHVAGALKHHLQGHRHLIGRMGPWLYRGRKADSGG